MSNKVTKKEKYAIIAEAMADNAMIVEFCENEIAALERKAEKAKERAAKKKAEGDELKNVVASILTSEFQTISDVAEQIEGEDITVGKISYRLNALVKEGIAVKEDVTVEVNGKNSKRKAYALA